MTIVIYNCLCLIRIGAHKFISHFQLKFGPFFLGKRLELGQAGWSPGYHMGLGVPPYILNGTQDSDYALQDADIILLDPVLDYPNGMFWIGFLMKLQ